MTDFSLTILPYQPADKNQLLTLISLNTPHNFAPEEASDFSQYLDNYVDEYYVLRNGEQIIACGGINYFPEQSKAHISWDMVHPELHRKGLGKMLLQFRLDRIKKRTDISTIIVNTSQLAEAFYAVNGFTKISEVKDYWAPGIHLVKMLYQ